ncbi:hypothetical protein LBMAG31_08160 [Nitrosomonadaceae bacterium]|nr:hypothetical protein LBMAG31_08160 [Nitrosomonadaceae bacterium]
MPFSKLYSISYDAFKFESPDGTDTTSIIAGLVRVTFTSLVGAIIKISYSEEQDEFKKRCGRNRRRGCWHDVCTGSW